MQLTYQEDKICAAAMAQPDAGCPGAFPTSQNAAEHKPLSLHNGYDASLALACHFCIHKVSSASCFADAVDCCNSFHQMPALGRSHLGLGAFFSS